jgi:hypothetical protein
MFIGAIKKGDRVTRDFWMDKGFEVAKVGPEGIWLYTLSKRDSYCYSAKMYPDNWLFAGRSKRLVKPKKINKYRRIVL